MSIPHNETHEITDDSDDRLKKSVAAEVFYQIAIDNLPHWFVRKIRKDSASSCDWICATGEGTDLLAQRLNVDVTGVDAAIDLIDAARSKYVKPNFLVADVDSVGDPAVTEYDVFFVINKLQRFSRPERVLEKIAASARKYLVVLVPYRAYRRPVGHASTFDSGNIPTSVAGRFSLVYSRVIAGYKPGSGDADGEHIILLYAADQEIPTLALSLDDLEIGKKPLCQELQLQRLRDELKSANQLFLDRTYLLEGKLREQEAEAIQRGRENAALRQSTSWRVTAPIRSLGRAASHSKKMMRTAARLTYRHAPLPTAWKQALKRSLVGKADASNPLAGGEPQVATEGAPNIVPRFIPPLRGPKDRADVFVWGAADWNAPHFRDQRIALDMARLGHRTYFFSTRFADEEQPGFRLEAVSRDGLLNVVYLNVASPRSIHDVNASSEMDASLRASLALFLVQAAPTSIISMLQHPFWLTLADQVPNRHLIYDVMADWAEDEDTELGKLHARAIRTADLVLVQTEGLAWSARDQGGQVLLLPGEGEQDGGGRARAISLHVDQYVPPLITLVLVSYNKLELTDACLHSLEKNTHYKNFEVIVVDNDSRDSTPEYLREWASRGENRRIILNADNRGFAAANNQGLQIARGEYLVLLNNDTYVTPGWLGTLVRHLKRNPAAGIVGPVTNNIGNESKIQISYDSMAEMEYAARVYTSSHMGEFIPLHTAAFFCVAFTREIYEKVGDLDEAFGIGMFEDDDYCRRVQQIGRTVICAEDAFIHHHHSASFNLMGMERRIKLFNENREVYEKKWGPWVPHEYREGLKEKN
ncbi:glycosyltransferase [Achromobacter spanius]|uniref:glycosyltransferase n=1 Tax=Achromobacter spanius TaxID=217203 RepID=UPI003209E5EC